MRNLLDINVIIALLDADHPAHATARRWLGTQEANGWASCPITQNGVLRIMSQPAYPNALPVQDVHALLSDAAGHPSHAFWPDDVSLLDDAVLDGARLLGPRQVTDLYLLALAVSRKGRFVSFDRTVPITAVKGARKSHLLVL